MRSKNALDKFMAERGLTSREDRASCALHLSINDSSNRLEYLELAAEAGCVNAAWAAADEYLRMGYSPAVLKRRRLWPGRLWSGAAAAPR